MSIKDSLNDPHGALSNWDEFSVDPCSWSMITCSSDYFVIGLLVFFFLPSHCHFILFILQNLTNFSYIFTAELPVNHSPEFCLPQSEI